MNRDKSLEYIEYCGKGLDYCNNCGEGYCVIHHIHICDDV